MYEYTISIQNIALQDSGMAHTAKDNINKYHTYTKIDARDHADIHTINEYTT